MDVILEEVLAILTRTPHVLDAQLRGLPGAVTLNQLLAAWVAHDLDHLNQVEKVMAVRYREAVGPWEAYLSILKPRA